MEYVDISPLKDGEIVLHQREGMKNPKYQIRIRLGGGKYLRLSSKTTQFKEAKRVAFEKCNILKTKEELGEDLIGVTYKKAFINWKKYTLGSTTTRGGKWERTVRTVELYSLTYFGKMKVKSIKPKDFINYAQWRQVNFKRTPPSNDSIIKEITAIRSFLGSGPIKRLDAELLS